MEMPAGDMMDGGMLGGSAHTEQLAMARLESLPDEPLAWVAHAFEMDEAMEPVTHRHAPGFVYSIEGTHRLTTAEEDVTLEAQQAVFVGEQVEHTHSGTGRFWEIRLTEPDASAPAGLETATEIFTSPELEGIPQPPVNLHFVLVEMPRQSQTSVHTHPGSEYIYISEGDIEYQNALVGTITMEEGEDHAVPANTAVQKRNPMGEAAIFLSWFVVDPDEPFASEASFE